MGLDQAASSGAGRCADTAEPGGRPGQNRAGGGEKAAEGPKAKGGAGIGRRRREEENQQDSLGCCQGFAGTSTLSPFVSPRAQSIFDGVPAPLCRASHQPAPGLLGPTPPEEPGAAERGPGAQAEP